VTNIQAKLVQASGASHAVTIADLSAQGLRLEGVERLTVGEQVLLLLPDNSVYELVIRWAFDDQAGGRFVE
jgi:hypothetical protein